MIARFHSFPFSLYSLCILAVTAGHIPPHIPCFQSVVAGSTTAGFLFRLHPLDTFISFCSVFTLHCGRDGRTHSSLYTLFSFSRWGQHNCWLSISGTSPRHMTAELVHFACFIRLALRIPTAGRLPFLFVCTQQMDIWDTLVALYPLFSLNTLANGQILSFFLLYILFPSVSTSTIQTKLSIFHTLNIIHTHLSLHGSKYLKSRISPSTHHFTQ